MRETKKILYTYSRPLPFVGLKGKENARLSTRSYYQAKREIFPSLEACFIDRFESICDEEIEKRKKSPPSGRELIRNISLHSGIEIKFFAQPQVRCSYDSLLESLEETMKDLMIDALDGYFPEYVKIFNGEPYIALDALLFRITKRKLENYSKKEISRIIKTEPEDKLFSYVNNKKRLILPSEFTTEGKDKINLEFLTDETFRKAVEKEEYEEELQLSAIEYLRAKEFRDSIDIATCIPFTEEIKRISRERKTSWIEIEDLLFYVPRTIREVTRYGEIFKRIFSTDKKSPGELYILMLDEKEYENAKKEFNAKKRGGTIYVPIEAVINKIRDYKERDEFKTIVEQYREIVPTMIF